jgi:hypothetical protein
VLFCCFVVAAIRHDFTTPQIKTNTKRPKRSLKRGPVEVFGDSSVQSNFNSEFNEDHMMLGAVPAAFQA